jgi:rare lipoprotein A
MRRRLGVFAALGLAILLAACAAQPPTPVLTPAPVAQPAEKPVFTQTGVASWYGSNHHGKTTANGEAFDMEAMTAAHRNLPFGTVVRVTNPTRNRTIKVRINDRGPYVDGRIIDLSARAARELGIAQNGVAQVRIEQFASDQAGR